MPPAHLTRSGHGLTKAVLLSLLMALICGTGAHWVHAAQQRYYAVLQIIQPRMDETIHSNLDEVEVRIHVVPPLRVSQGDRVRIILDGKTLPHTWTSTRFLLRDVYRGTHTLRAVIIDREGVPLIASNRIVFYQWHASRLFPGR